MKHIGRQIDRLIQDRDLKQKDVAEEMGMSAVNLSKILKKESIDASLIERFANFFNVPVSYFFMDNVKPGTQSTSIGNSNTTIAVAEGGSRYEVGARGGKDEERNRLIAENEMLKRLIAEKDLLIAEKERMIQVLMKK